MLCCCHSECLPGSMFGMATSQSSLNYVLVVTNTIFPCALLRPVRLLLWRGVVGDQGSFVQIRNFGHQGTTVVVFRPCFLLRAARGRYVT